MPVVTVIVPVYNTASCLGKCLYSLSRQDYSDFEVVLIDDGSTDDSWDLCRNYANEHPRIHAIHQDNKGLSSARNAGIEWAFNYSDSRFLAFVDSDDYVDSVYLSTLLSAIQNADMAIANYCVENERGEILHSPQPIQARILSQTEFWDLNSSTKLGYTSVMWNKLFKKELFASVRFLEGAFHEDQEILHKIICQTDRISCSAVPVYHYVRRVGSITGSAKTKQKCQDSIRSFLNRALYLFAHNDARHAGIALNRAIFEFCELAYLFGFDSRLRQELVVATRQIGSRQTKKTRFRWTFQVRFPRVSYKILARKAGS